MTKVSRAFIGKAIESALNNGCEIISTPKGIFGLKVTQTTIYFSRGEKIVDVSLFQPKTFVYKIIYEAYKNYTPHN